jgi:hypothetical protein
MHMLAAHGQPGWVAALTPLSVDGMIVAASTALLADSRSGGRGGLLPWVLLVTGSVASLAANVAVAEPTVTGNAEYLVRVRHWIICAALFRSACYGADRLCLAEAGGSRFG